jgi:hypothetical protein
MTSSSIIPVLAHPASLSLRLRVHKGMKAATTQLQGTNQQQQQQQHAGFCGVWH